MEAVKLTINFSTLGNKKIHLTVAKSSKVNTNKIHTMTLFIKYYLITNLSDNQRLLMKRLQSFDGKYNHHHQNKYNTRTVIICPQ